VRERESRDLSQPSQSATNMRRWARLAKTSGCRPPSSRSAVFHARLKTEKTSTSATLNSRLESNKEAEERTERGGVQRVKESVLLLERVAEVVHGPRICHLCSGSEAGSYSTLIDFVYHSTLGLRVIQKKTKVRECGDR